MAQWVQAPFTKPDDSSFIHRTHMVKGKKLPVGMMGRAPATGGCLQPGSVARLPYRPQEEMATTPVTFRAGSTMVPSRGEQGQVT